MSNAPEGPRVEGLEPHMERPLQPPAQSSVVMTTTLKNAARGLNFNSSRALYDKLIGLKAHLNAFLSYRDD